MLNLLSDFLLCAVSARVVHALREVLDESDTLSDADLLLFCQLSGQSGLAGCWVVDGHVDLFLQTEGLDENVSSNYTLCK